MSVSSTYYTVIQNNTKGSFKAYPHIYWKHPKQECSTTHVEQHNTHLHQNKHTHKHTHPPTHVQIVLTYTHAHTTSCFTDPCTDRDGGSSPCPSALLITNCPLQASSFVYFSLSFRFTIIFTKQDIYENL